MTGSVDPWSRSRPAEAYWIIGNYPYLHISPRFVLVTVAWCAEGGPVIVDQVAALVTLSVPTVAKHLAWWKKQGAVAVTGKGPTARVEFLGSRAWREITGTR